MRLATAIARSPGNKAECLSDSGHRVIIQERYAGIDQRWFHLWELTRDGAKETDFPSHRGCAIQEIYKVDFMADYWEPL